MVTKWLITGGCGFLGTSVIRRLKAEGGHAFRVLDNLSVGTPQDLAEVTEYYQVEPGLFEEPGEGECQLLVGDIRDAELAEEAARRMDVIIHFAANTGVPNSVSNPRLDMESNVIGTFNMLEAARVSGVKRFVFASSGAPAGEVKPPIHEELPPHPVSPYGASKLAGEGYCSAYHRTYGLETVALRFGNVYGPGSRHKSSVVAKFIRLALEGKPVEVYGDGSQTRDFIYIDDLVDAVYRAGTVEGIGGETYQIATARETTLNELVEILKAALKEAGVDMEVRYGEKRLGDVMRNYSDTTKARKQLGWHVLTDLGEGLGKTVAWFRNEKR